MKAKALAFEEFQGKGVLDFATYSSLFPDSFPGNPYQTLPQKWLNNTSKERIDFSYVGSTKATATATVATASPSSSTLSSTHNSGGGGSADTAGVATEVSGNLKSLVDSVGGKCGMGVVEDDWGSIGIQESGVPTSPGQENSIFRLLMGDIEDPEIGLTKLLQSGGVGGGDLAFNGGGFGVLDHQGLGFMEPPSSVVGNNNNVEAASSSKDSPSDFNVRLANVTNTSPLFSSSVSNSISGSCLPVSLPFDVLANQSLDEKAQGFSLQGIVNPTQIPYSPNPSLFVPLSQTQMQEHQLLSPLPPKQLNSGNSGVVGLSYPVSGTVLQDSGQELFVRRQQPQLQLHPQQFQPRPALVMEQKSDVVVNQLEQAIIEQLYKAVELIESGNPLLAQGILARLNQQLSPIGKPFQRAAFYFSEALQLILQANNNNPSMSSPYSLLYKIGAYKAFSEISPVLQFANFTCNQAFLEALEGFDRVHILSFDVGYGGQWASLIQELASRREGAPSLKITAFASPSTHEELELVLTQENLKHFASENNMVVEFEVINIEALASGSWMLPLHISNGEAVVVNLPLSSFANYPAYLPMTLRLVKQLSPKIVVSLDRGCDRNDTPFPHHMIHAIQCYTSLLESLDAVNLNLDILQKIERYLLQPQILKIVTGRHQSPVRLVAWRSVFASSGFSQVAFSNFNELQAECLLKRTPVRGFHVEKKHHSLVLCWQRKELIAVSMWKC